MLPEENSWIVAVSVVYCRVVCLVCVSFFGLLGRLFGWAHAHVVHAVGVTSVLVIVRFPFHVVALEVGWRAIWWRGALGLVVMLLSCEVFEEFWQCCVLVNFSIHLFSMIMFLIYVYH